MKLGTLCITWLAAASLAQSAQAQDSMSCNLPGNACVTRVNTTSGEGAAFKGEANNSVNAVAVFGSSAKGEGVRGNGLGSKAGVGGSSKSGNGVEGDGGSNGVAGTTFNTGGSGVYGQNLSNSGYGVAGRALGFGTAVLGDNANGNGWSGFFTGRLYAAEGHKPGGGSWTTFSDARLKKDVKTLQGGLERLLKLRGVTFSWIEPAKQGNLSGPQIGMIAQEVEQVFPEWVQTDSSGYKTLTVRGFEALTVEGLRAVHQDNQSLRRENQALFHQVEDLEERMRKVEEKRSELAAGYGSHGFAALGGMALAMAAVLTSRRRAQSARQ